MQELEFAVLDWIQQTLRGPVLDVVMPAVSRLCDHGELWIALAVVLILCRKERRTGVIVACALVLDLICCNLLLKPLIARVRPCDLNPAVLLLIPRPADWSFPSGHTAASFAAVGALWAERSRLRRPALAVAAVVAFSRLYLYVHWPSDVLGGVLLGLFLGIFSRWLLRKTGLDRRLGGEDPEAAA